MLLLTHEHHDPAFNLACEEYFLTKTSCELFMLWRNGPSVIVGRNQDARAEIDEQFTGEKNINVMRRITGGGAVFHDLGNINYSTIARHSGPIDFSRYCAPVIALLRSLGLDAALSGRNDILIDGYKVSGNAQTVRAGRVLHHGTLLYAADLSELSGALHVNSDKYKGRAVPSVSSRVRNIASFLAEPPPVEEFSRALYSALLGSLDGAAPYTLTEADLLGIEEVRLARYAKPEWTFAPSNEYNFEGSVRLPAGGVRVRLLLRGGVIASASVTGDFFGGADIAGFERRLPGLPHTADALRGAFSDDDIAQYFTGFSWDELAEAFV